MQAAVDKWFVAGISTRLEDGIRQFPMDIKQCFRYLG
jgi:hypothetical protein